MTPTLRATPTGVTAGCIASWLDATTAAGTDFARLKTSVGGDGGMVSPTLGIHEDAYSLGFTSLPTTGGFGVTNDRSFGSKVTPNARSARAETAARNLHLPVADDDTFRDVHAAGGRVDFLDADQALR